VTRRTQAGGLHHSRPRDCRAVRVFRPAFRLPRRRPASCGRARWNRCRKSHWKCIVISRGRTPLFLRIVRLFTRCSREGEADPLARSGATGNGCPYRGRQLRARRPAIRAGHSAQLGVLPAASTEVVLAEGYGSALPLAVGMGGRWPGARNDGALVPVIGRQPARAFLSSLIPVLVTGIQRAQVLGHDRLISHWHGFIHGADAPWLDSCDKHRNEGGRGGRAHPPQAVLS